MEVRIIRSERRRRTVSARMEGNVLLVRAPAGMPQARLDAVIADFRARFRLRALRERMNRDEDLAARARLLSEKYFGGELVPAWIGYVTGQRNTFGCCYHRTGRIRISLAVGAMPRWVRDYILVHEMAHLREPRHDAAFWKLVARYPLAERARGYLLGAGMREEGEERRRPSPAARQGELFPADGQLH
jgi:predicted metal-dependent hydrolase